MINQLPKDCLVVTFKFLNYLDLSIMAKVCNFFHQTTKIDYLWKTFLDDSIKDELKDLVEESIKNRKNWKSKFRHVHRLIFDIICLCKHDIINLVLKGKNPRFSIDEEFGMTNEKFVELIKKRVNPLRERELSNYLDELQKTIPNKALAWIKICGRDCNLWIGETSNSIPNGIGKFVVQHRNEYKELFNGELINGIPSNGCAYIYDYNWKLQNIIQSEEWIKKERCNYIPQNNVTIYKVNNGIRTIIYEGNCKKINFD